MWNSYHVNLSNNEIKGDKVMTREEIKVYDGDIVSYDVLEEIELSPVVTDLVNLGNSGLHVGHTWYLAVLTTREEVSVYA